MQPVLDKTTSGYQGRPDDGQQYREQYNGARLTCDQQRCNRLGAAEGVYRYVWVPDYERVKTIHTLTPLISLDSAELCRRTARSGTSVLDSFPLSGGRKKHITQTVAEGVILVFFTCKDCVSGQDGIRHCFLGLARLGNPEVVNSNAKSSGYHGQMASRSAYQSGSSSTWFAGWRGRFPERRLRSAVLALNRLQPDRKK